MEFVYLKACSFVYYHGLHLDLRLKPFIAERFLPSSVFGPVLNPP